MKAQSRKYSEISSEVNTPDSTPFGDEMVQQKKPKKIKKMKFRPDKLLVLDLNKVLIYRHPFSSTGYELRPYAMDFIKRMSKLFVLAIWSSAKKETVKRLTKKLFKAEEGFCRSRFAFIWTQAQCDIDGNEMSSNDDVDAKRATNYYGNAKKPLMRKNLSKVVESFPEYGGGKVLLIDDEPKKTDKNPSASIINIKPFCPKEGSENVMDFGDLQDEELKESSALSQHLTALAHQQGDLY